MATWFEPLPLKDRVWRRGCGNQDIRCLDRLASAWHGPHFNIEYFRHLATKNLTGLSIATVDIDYRRRTNSAYPHQLGNSLITRTNQANNGSIGPRQVFGSQTTGPSCAHPS